VNAEILSYDKVGFAANSAGDWYAALANLFDESALGPRMGALGRRVVEGHYSVKANAPKLAEIFKEVVAEDR
jgi:glycosyltransferase involved in cell wall biosynthesis